MENEKKDTNKDTIIQDINSPKKQRIIFLSLAVLLLTVASISCSLFDDLYDKLYKGIPSPEDATRTSIKVAEVALKKTVDAATGTQEYKDDAAVLTEYWKVNAPILTGIVSTQTSIRKTDLAMMENVNKTQIAHQATWDSEVNKVWMTQTAEAKIPKPPVLERIMMDSYIIPKTGEATWVTVKYKDPDGDVSHYECEEVEALDWTCAKNEIKYFTKGTKKSGEFRFTLRCYVNQNVTLKMRLYDKKGNVSKPYTLSFVCR